MMGLRSRFFGAGVLATMVVVLTVFASSAAAQATPVVVASGLDSPRHLSFSPDGELYVVEAGRGGPRRRPHRQCVDHPLGLFCLGFTGGVTLVRDARSRRARPDRPAVDLNGSRPVARGARPVRHRRSPATRSSC